MSHSQRDILTTVYLEQRPALLRFLCARMRNPERAEDVLQDVYLKLTRSNLPKVIDNPSGFLFRMASNLALDHIRKSKRARLRDQAWSDLNSEKVGSEFQSDAPHADDALIAKERLTTLKVRLQTLSPKAREAFERHKFEGQSYKQVADQMGISTGTVGKHLSKAIKHIMESGIGGGKNE
ncbi:MAG: RNA polymerase subunit sigma-24 [Robiginitomaculum sp.]|nr:MAG: RNA polymerase subunit sigma-24 [Robiginitomaculum sp.]